MRDRLTHRKKEKLDRLDTQRGDLSTCLKNRAKGEKRAQPCSRASLKGEFCIVKEENLLTWRGGAVRGQEKAEPRQTEKTWKRRLIGLEGMKVLSREKGAPNAAERAKGGHGPDSGRWERRALALLGYLEGGERGEGRQKNPTHKEDWRAARMSGGGGWTPVSSYLKGKRESSRE